MKRRIYRQERERAALLREAEAKILREKEVRREQVTKIRLERHRGMNYYIFKKGRITREKELGIWHRDGDNVYMRCLGCFTILKIDWKDILPDGCAENCVVCDDEDSALEGCGAHQWVMFKSFWDKEGKSYGR